MSVKMGCPYVFCSAVVEAKWMRTSPERPGAQRLMVPDHDIQNSILHGPCPAGMMWIPLEPRARELLTEFAQKDGATIEHHLNNPPEPTERDRSTRLGGGFPIRPVNPSGIPHRLGREPVTEGDQGDWNPPRGEEPYKAVPPYVGGGNPTRKGFSVASISELIAMTTEANASTGEALGAIAQCSQSIEGCLGAIERAQSLVAAVLDDSNAQTMSEYRALLAQAEDNIRSVHGPLEQALGELGAGMEHGESFIGKLMS